MFGSAPACSGASIRFVRGGFMPVASGELIRMMNYVDDISATLRRIQASMTIVTPEERKRLAEYMKNSNPNYMGILETLDKG
jgi:hypothetical protein